MNFISLVIFIGSIISPLPVWANPGPHDFKLVSPAFEDNGVIPKQYTCDGVDVNPPLAFKNVPSQTKSMALTISDPDAPSGTWSHWVIYNIPPNTGEIVENSNPGTAGKNDFGKYAYGGPCPPDHKVHHYIFHAYALDAILSENEEPAISRIKKDLQGHIIAQTRLVGTYQK